MISLLLPIFSIFLTFFPGYLSAAEVTLQTLEIYQTHEWLHKPTIYFQCRGENKTVLPDVKKTSVSYTFKGEESWQPLTEFSSTKCKRCGFYEKDLLSDDKFDEWELCPSDFTAPDGKFTHVKNQEFNATFLCSTCADVREQTASRSDPTTKGLSIAIVVLISAIVTILIILVLIGGFRHWQKKKRQQEQARFLKLFEEHDDIEDELGLRDVI